MIDDEMRTQMENSFEVLVKHNLYRRGCCDMETADIAPKELGAAIDIAAGAILEYLRTDEKLKYTMERLTEHRANAKHYEDEWKNANNTIDRLYDRLQNALQENQRLKALLASHRIKYKR